METNMEFIATDAFGLLRSYSRHRIFLAALD